ncbi:MAG: Na+/H+ antiporter NhaA [Pseudobacter sp.]|uniref:Na+/H+ antiporter NhaA n=1 Tax=Pseudobacter sp. TaxID=2045420 RepID=UPI003F7ECA83
MNYAAFKRFFKSVSGSGGILLFCVLASLIIANTPAGAYFETLLNTQLGYHSENIHLQYPVILWINDGLMAVFFLLVGLEIKRELAEGELSSPKKALLPVLCATGGAIVPALIYAGFNHSQSTAAGWGIPMATDIAFALAVINVIGSRIPASLKIFLAALAIVDDLMAILVIAIFYSSEIHLTYLSYAGGIFALLLLFNKLGIKNLVFYLIPGLFIWYFIHHSGIHATIAGVLTAMAISASAKGSAASPLVKLEHMLSKPVNYLIVPLFALCNTNIKFEDGMLNGLFTPLGIGVVTGLVIGKPVGILLMSWLAVKTKLSELPTGANWQHITGVGFLAGIGFTMSIFITLLSFNEAAMISISKFAILTGSILAVAIGYCILTITKTGK